MKLSDRALAITPSATVQLTAEVARQKALGIDVLAFSMGEPDFDTPSNIREALKTAVDKGLTRYTTSSGILELKKAVSEKLERDNGLHYESSRIAITCGAKAALYQTMQTLVQEGDEVIIIAPCWVSYCEMVKLAGATPVLVRAKASCGYVPDVSDIQDAVTPRTKAIMVNSPNNPTGAVYPKETLEEIGRLSERTGIAVVTDEVYEKLVYGDARHWSIPALVPGCKDNCIVINGFSKTYAMTGLRIGYAAGPLDFIKAFNALQTHLTGNVATPVQHAAVEALSGDQECVSVMKDEFQKRRDYVVSRLEAIDGISCPKPDGAFYVMPDISALTSDDAAFCSQLLEKKHVAIVPGSAFAEPGTVRIAYSASMEQIREAMDRIEDFVRSVK